MSLLLDGVRVPGIDHRVNVSEQIERKDLSGDTSASAGSHGGWKPAIVSVKVLVDMKDPDDLAALRLLYHATDGSLGIPKLYEISQPTCQAMGIHRVRFTDFFKVAPRQRERVWEVSVTLIEERGIPERTEARQSDPAPKSLATPTGLQTPAGDPAPSGEDGMIERVLSVLNEQAGNIFFGGGA